MAKPQQLHPTDPFEQPLDGTAGGALDSHDDDQAPEGGKAVTLQNPNSPQVKKIFLQAVADLKTLDAQAEEINAKRRAITEKLESFGLNRHGLRASLRQNSMKQTKRENFDLTMALCREWLEDPIQYNWIDDTKPAKE